MGSDRSLIDSRPPPVSVADHDALTDWLVALPSVGRDEAEAMVGAMLARLSATFGVRLGDIGPDTGHPVVDAMPDSLLALETPGRMWEALMAPADRRRAGSHYTPIASAELLTQLARRFAREAPHSVLDPAVGTGSFLLGAASVLEAEGHDRADIVSSMSGFDLDPVALAICRATLELWCGGQSRPTVSLADALVDDLGALEGTIDLVVGNPPFLGQLAADTARAVNRRSRLAERFGSAASGYVDEAALFLVLAARLVSSTGVAVLLAPQSVLGSAHAAAAREAVADATDLAAVWIEASPTFDAAVDVCAPVLVPAGSGTGYTEAVVGDARAGIAIRAPMAASWSPILAGAQGVPSVRLPGDRTLGSVADATAGFRQHFYGLVGSVREAEAGDDLRLVTAGAIDPFRLNWGHRTVRFAGDHFDRPVVDLDSIADAGVRDWMTDRLRPKVLVATQTRVVEAVVDERGRWIPSVPVICIESDELDPWLIAAVAAAPGSSARLAARAAGTGLSAGAIRLRARDLLALPLPIDAGAWSDGAELVRDAHAAAEFDDWESYRDAIEAFAVVMNRAQGLDTQPETWWLDRLQFPG